MIERNSIYSPLSVLIGLICLMVFLLVLPMGSMSGVIRTELAGDDLGGSPLPSEHRYDEIKVTPDGKFIVWKRVWEIFISNFDGDSICALKKHYDYIQQPHYSIPCIDDFLIIDNGTKILTQGNGYGVLWNTADWKPTDTLQNVKGRGRLSSDGRAIVLGSHEPSNVWDAKTGEVKFELEKGFKKYGSYDSPDLSPDGRYIAAVEPYSGDAKVWDANSGKLIDVIGWHQLKIHNVFFSPDSKLLCSVESHRNVSITTVSNGRLLKAWRATDQYILKGGAFSPDSRLVFLLGLELAKAFNVNTGELAYDLGEGKSGQHVFFAKKGGVGAVCLDEEILKIFKATDGQVLHTIKMSSGVVSLDFTPDGSKFVTCSLDGTAKIWNVKTGKPIAELKIRPAKSSKRGLWPDENSNKE